VRRTSSPFSGAGRRLAFRLLLTAPLLIAGCQVIGGSGSTESGSGQGVVYQGFIEIDGGSLPAALEIIREGRRGIRGALQATSGIMAEGEGRLRGQTLSLELVYGGNCPGRMSLEGEWDQDSRTYEGVVEASDCTGKGGGTFRFSAS
jgi:hypothetical protein